MLVIVSCLVILLLALILLDDLDSIFQIDSPEISGLFPQFSLLISKINLWKSYQMISPLFMLILQNFKFKPVERILG